MNDETLMRAVRDGEVHRLGVLFDRYHRQLFGFFYRMLDDRASAEDLVQDVFVRVLKYRHTYQDNGSFVAWLFRIARNARHDFAKKHPALNPIEEALEAPMKGPGPGVQFEQREQVALLKQALKKLPAEKRELIVLARWHGMNYEQLGELMDADAATIRVRLHRAIRQLEGILRQLHEVTPGGL